MTQGPEGDPFTRTLKVKGKWLFFCDIHPGEMEQTITVR